MTLAFLSKLPAISTMSKDGSLLIALPVRLATVLACHDALHVAARLLAYKTGYYTLVLREKCVRRVHPLCIMRRIKIESVKLMIGEVE